MRPVKEVGFIKYSFLKWPRIFMRGHCYFLKRKAPSTAGNCQTNIVHSPTIWNIAAQVIGHSTSR